MHPNAQRQQSQQGQQSQSNQRQQGHPKRRFACSLLIYSMAFLALAGCRSYGVVVNEKQSPTADATQYSLSSFNSSNRDPNLFLTLTFSGGGSRASALAYGVLLELRDTTITVDGVSRRLLDEVDIISSVSGGSFTAAYYGLNGDRIFDDFEKLFLRDDPEKHLIYGLLNPLTWLDHKGRSESAIKYFNKALFDDATFKDMMNPDLPMIIMNTSDLAYGIRFSFVQEYFDLLCSDLLSFPIARAVTASAAVPMIFTPIVIENYGNCNSPAYGWVQDIKDRSAGNLALANLAENLESYKNKEQRKYIHFVDGGITDNTGILALYDLVEMSGGITPYMQDFQKSTPLKMMVIEVNASAKKDTHMGLTDKEPDPPRVMSAVTDAQLHRYDTASTELLESQLPIWAETLSTPDDPVSTYFVDVAFERVEEPELAKLLNAIPTSFKLSDDQVDGLIKAGRELLRSSPEFQQFLSDSGGKLISGTANDTGN